MLIGHEWKGVKKQQNFLLREDMNTLVCRLIRAFLNLRKTFSVHISLHREASAHSWRLHSWALFGEQKQDKLSWDSDRSLPGETIQHLGPMLVGHLRSKRDVAEDAQVLPWQCPTCWVKVRWAGEQKRGMMTPGLTRVLATVWPKSNSG